MKFRTLFCGLEIGFWVYVTIAGSNKVIPFNTALPGIPKEINDAMDYDVVIAHFEYNNKVAKVLLTECS